MSYSSEQRRCAVAWKRRTESLPEGTRNPAPFVGKNGRAIGAVYPFCLPTEFAAWKLLPQVRTGGLKLFADLGIPWHAGVSGGPGYHLLSSQPQPSSHGRDLFDRIIGGAGLPGQDRPPPVRAAGDSPAGR